MTDAVDVTETDVTVSAVLVSSAGLEEDEFVFVIGIIV